MRIPSVERELLAAQVEVATSPTDSPAAARAQLAELRAGLAEVGREHGLLVLASGTQPLARWDRQRQTKKERYDRLAADADTGAAQRRLWQALSATVDWIAATTAGTES